MKPSAIPGAGEQLEAGNSLGMLRWILEQASPEPVEATRGCGRLNQSSCLKHWLRSGPWRAPGFDTGLLLI